VAGPLKVLFLCTGNSARSILAEYLLRRMGGGRFEVFSAGARPTGVVNPLALKVLRERFAIDAGAARSKSWEELKDVSFDFVVTVCDKARESCPIWPGQPIVAHWGSEDPAAVEGDLATRERAFVRVALEIKHRLSLFCALPMENLERLRLERAVREIASSTGGA
jgi:arsenate reductase (thioredoxin)